MSNLAQFHTAIDKNTLKSFKKLCKNYNAPFSRGIRVLIEKALDDNKLPLLNKPKENDYINKLKLGRVLNSYNLQTLPNQKSAIKIVQSISKQIIPNEQSSYWSFVTQLQLQLLLLAIGLDSHVLLRFISIPGKIAHWPQSTLNFLHFAYSIDRDGMLNHDNKWYNESLSLSNYLRDGYLNKYIHESLLKQQAMYFDLSNINKLRPIIDWHLIKFIKQNTTLEQREHMANIKASDSGFIFEYNCKLQEEKEHKSNIEKGLI